MNRYCPLCKAEYVADIVKCSDCDVDLVDSLPPDESEMIPQEHEFIAIEDFETVYEGDEPVHAQLVLKLLESSGFNCKILGAHEVRYPPTLPLVVQVEAVRADEAKELIDAYENQPTSDFDAVQ